MYGLDGRAALVGETAGSTTGGSLGATLGPNGILSTAA